MKRRKRTLTSSSELSEFAASAAGVGARCTGAYHFDCVSKGISYLDPSAIAKNVLVGAC